jgi:diguanylate cyclase (GGDEF)-like protein
MEDPLTGLANRRQFEEALSRASASPPSSGSSHGVFMLDMNDFKKINDLHGHPVGDEVLIEVGSRLRQAIREGDLVARLGGDEFAVLAMHLASPDAAISIARRIIELVDAPIMAKVTVHHVGTAIGIALMPQDGDQSDVVRKADIALYRAKAEGRSALRFFEEEMDAQLRERDLLERELRLAVEADSIRPFFQPLVELKTGRIVGFEALARWYHPVLGQVPPDRFIPVADNCGLIGRLTDQLLRHACAEAVLWPSDMTLSFNISPSQLRDVTLGLRLITILAESGLPPCRLEIELTESALVGDLKHAQEILGSIRGTGVRIALDDFGTGYSSLYHLRAFKLDKIKIDRSFVAAMANNPESAAIVRALIGLGAGLNLQVTAEGVETVDQEASLLAQGCDQAQGFLFSEAVSGDEAMALVSKKPAKRA